MKKAQVMAVRVLLLVVFAVGAYLLRTSEVSARTIATDVDEAAAGNVLMGIEGAYKEAPNRYIKRVNAIRLEACKEGYRDPRDPSRSLTIQDYVPVKWSFDLQYIARIRAAEAAVYKSHTRPNGNSCFSITSKNEVVSSAEVLAWGGDGIDLWYAQKDAWSMNKKGVTTHYQCLINPDNRYMAISYFYSESGIWNSTYAGEFSEENTMDSDYLVAESNVLQKVEVQLSKVGTYQIISPNDAYVINKGAYKRLRVKAMVNYKGQTSRLNYLGNVNWTSSKPKRVKVDENGRVWGKRYGSSMIFAIFDGEVIKQKIRVRPTLKTVYLRHLTPGLGRVKVVWKKGNRKITGYQIEYSRSSKFSSKSKAIFVRGRNREHKVIGNLASGHIYYFRIRSFKKVRGKRFFSAWSFTGNVKVS